MLVYPLAKRMHGIFVILNDENEHQKFMSCFDKMDEKDGRVASIRKALIVASEFNRKNKDMVNSTVLI